MKKILLFLAALLAAAFTALAQSSEPFSPYSQFRPSAEAWQMTRYGGLTPSLYTGAMTFSVPLYTYEDPDFNIPVTLVYNFDGYRPAQHSGSIGYGWALDCGGVITREVRGIPDEGDLDDGRNYSSTVHGWRQASPANRVSSGMDFSPVYSIYRPSSTFVDTQACLGRMLACDVFYDTPGYAVSRPGGYSCELYDTAPDLYHFRFLGHSGDFAMMADGSVRVFNTDLPHGQFSVSFSDNPDHLEDVAITLTSGDGYAYVFRTEGVNECHDPNGDRIRPSRSVSSYRLTRIIAPNGRTADFAYNTSRYYTSSPRYDTMRDGTMHGSQPLNTATHCAPRL